MAFLQSYADDSASNSGDQRLFMAGYMGLAQNWANFSGDWTAALQMHPKINYLKMVEAQNLRGEFRYWSETSRNQKLTLLADVINRYPFTSFEFSLSRAAFNKQMKPHVPRGVANPHFIANFHVVSGLARYLEDQDVKIEFVFDTQKGVDADIHLFFEYMARNIPKKARQKISGIPIFKDDKDVLPLQAADMAAWFLRRTHQMGKDSLPISYDTVFRHEHHIYSEIPDDTLESWGDTFASTPELRALQSKPQWQRFRKEMTEILATGFVPPYGTRFKNTVHDFRERFASFIDEN